MALRYNPQTGKFEDSDPVASGSTSGAGVTRYNPASGKFEKSGSQTSSAIPQQPIGEKPSLLKRIGGFGLNVAKEVALSPVRVAAAPFAILQEGLLNQKIGDDPTKLGKFAFGSGKIGSNERGFGALERVVDIGATALTGGIGKSAVAAGQQAGKAGIKSGVKQFAKQTLRPTALATDAAVGGAFGFTGAKAEGADTNQALKSTLIGAGIGLAAPPILGVGIKGASVLAKSSAKAVGGALESAAISAETRAARLATLADESYLPKDLFAAERATKTANLLRGVQRAPSAARTGFLEPFAALEKPQQFIKEKTGETVDLKAIAEEVPSAAGGRTQQLTTNLLDTFKKAESDIGTLTKYSKELNSLDRLRQGNLVEGGADEATINARIAKLFEGKSPEEVARIQSLQKEWQTTMEAVLQDALDSGNITQQQFAAFRQTHPNYLPNEVKDFLEMPNNFTRESGLQSSEFKAAKGSTRKLENPLLSSIDYIRKWTLRNHQNKAAQEIFDKIDSVGLQELGINEIQSLQDVLTKKELASLLSNNKGAKIQLEKVNISLEKMLKEKTIEKAGLKSALGQQQSPVISKIQVKDELVDNTPKKYIESYLTDPADKSGELKRIQQSIGLRDSQIAEITSLLEPARKSLVLINQKRKGAFQELQALNKKTTPNKAVDLWKNRKETFTFRRNGEEVIYEVPVELGHALKNLDPNDISFLGGLLETPLGKALQAPANLLRATATQYNPLFALIRNPIRDFQNARITSNLAVGEYANTMLGTIANAIAPNSKLGQKFAKSLEEAELAGGIIGSGFFNKEKSVASIVSKSLGKGNIISSVVRHPLRTIEDIGGAIENNTRLAVYISELKRGATSREAAYVARNATADFSKAGAWTKELNKVIPYLNARIRGVDALAQAFQKDAVGTVRKSMYNAAYPAFVLHKMNSQYESYNNIPSWEKKSYWIIMTGEMPGKTYDGTEIKIPLYIKIPKGEAQQVVATITDKLLGNAPQETTAEFLGGLASSVSPVTLDQGVVSAVLPTAIKVPVELATNYDFFRKKQIIPDYVPIPETGKTAKSNEVKAGRRANYDSSEISKTLGGLLNISPAQIDHAIRIGVLKDIFDAIDISVSGTDTSAMPIEQNNTFDFSTTPGLRTFFGSNYYGQFLTEKEQATLKAIEDNEAKIEEALRKNLQGGDGVTRYNPTTGKFEQ